MSEKNQNTKHLSELIYSARQKKGWTSLKELYRELNPKVDYQTWLHAEAGRRTPHPDSLLEIGSILGISKEDLIIAYCKDKFPDQESHQIVDSFLYKKFIDVDTLFEARQLEDEIAHIFTTEQVAAMKKDIRVRLYLTYTYNRELKTNFSRLTRFFQTDITEVKKVIDKLVNVGLVTVDGEEITRIHRHTIMPTTKDLFEFRRDLLVKSLENNIKPNSYIANFHLLLSENSLKKIMAFIYFAEANFVKFTKKDYENKGKSDSRVQIAIIANKIDEGDNHE